MINTMKNAKPETIAARLAELLTSLQGDVFLEVLLAILKHIILHTSNANSPIATDNTSPRINDDVSIHVLTIYLQNISLIP